MVEAAPGLPVQLRNEEGLQHNPSPAVARWTGIFLRNDQKSP